MGKSQVYYLWRIGRSKSVGSVLGVPKIAGHALSFVLLGETNFTQNDRRVINETLEL